MPNGQLLEGLRARTSEMVDSLAALVEVESPSSDLVATAACTDVADDLALKILGTRAERVVVDGRTHLRWRFGPRTDVVLIGHLDTVWPLGTSARWPFSVSDDVATGPGSFDMKAGVIQLLYAISALDERDGVTVLLTTDEEVGSPTARGVIEETVPGAKAALILEPSLAGALKTERKGVSAYDVRVIGRGAHAGLDPEKGINAGIELAHQILTIAALGRPEVGTTVTPTLLQGGSSGNTVPAEARVHVDARFPTAEEQDRVHEALLGLTPVLAGSSLRVRQIGGAPPLPRSASAALYELACRVAEGLGLGPIEERSVGGGSDGNFTAGLGIPTLDGLGAVGDGAHAEGEHVIVSAMPERAALVAALVAELTGQRGVGSARPQDEGV